MSSRRQTIRPVAATLAKDTLDQILARVRQLSVWVIGDVILDEYALGDTDRISPEAPVPVLRVAHTESRLGGAANVARQAAVLGARVTLAGIVGADAAGDRIAELCAASGIDCSALRRHPDRATTRKLRALARHQQLLRVDYETTQPCDAADVAWWSSQLEATRSPDVVIVSDYAKGVVTPSLLAHIRARTAAAGIQLVVDPKQRDFNAYRGAQLLTPNVRELAGATGRELDPADTDAIAECAQAMARALGADALVVTCGARGVVVAPADGPCSAVAACGRTLFDPTGAGDTAVTVLALARAAGASLMDAAAAANAAAGVTVGEIGTASATAADIRDALAGSSGVGKVMERPALVEQIARWRTAGRKIVFTNGCFDLLHVGHLSLLYTAAAQGDALVVAINSDASVRRLKGAARPLVPARERAAMLAALDCVDAVTIFDEDTPLDIVQAVRPDVLVKGQDYRLDQVVGHDLVESLGGTVALVPLVAERSTTALVRDILQRFPNGIA